MNCNPNINTNNSTEIYAEAGANCSTYDKSPWWANDQPSIVAKNGQCVGFIDVPQAVICQGSYPTTRRICNCDAPTKKLGTIGTGYSQGYTTPSAQCLRSTSPPPPP